MFSFLERVDRRIIYILVAVSVAVPLIFNVSLRPAPMATADAFFTAVERLEPGKIVLISADFGPGTLAENRPQAELAIEHLMRKRIGFAMISVYALASPFLRQLPEDVAARLEREMPGQKWEYGKDWINLGFQPGGMIAIQGIAKAEDMRVFLKTDANNIPLEDLPLMKDVKSIKDISLLMQFTGLLGVFNAWVQYFQGPLFLHGCTSVTIPEAFIYFSSKQIAGFFEGIAGAAWYEVMLSERFPQRGSYNVALRVNTGLSFAHLVVLAFIVLGNAGLLFGRRKE